MQMPAQAAQSSAVIAVFHLVGLQLETVIAIFADVFQRVSGNRSNDNALGERSKPDRFIEFILNWTRDSECYLNLSIRDFDAGLFVIFLPNDREHAARVAHQNDVEAVDRDGDADVSEHG